MYIWSHRARNAKQKVIVKYENNILSMIENKLNERAGMTFFINSSQETGRKEKQEQRRHFVNKSKEAKPK